MSKIKKSKNQLRRERAKLKKLAINQENNSIKLEENGPPTKIEERTNKIPLNETLHNENIPKDRELLRKKEVDDFLESIKKELDENENENENEKYNNNQIDDQFLPLNENDN